LLREMMTHTFSIISHPMPPHTPMERTWLLKYGVELRQRNPHAPKAVSTATIAASTGPFSPFIIVITAYSMTNTRIQMPKKVPCSMPTLPPPLRASEADQMIQYTNPASTVTTAPQRNHHRARSVIDF